MRAELLIKGLMRLKAPSTFAITWIVAMVILGYHLSMSWDFPWLSNPDQDLVFLRDGLRLFNLSKPGYSDHPGLIQMLIGAASQFLFKITTSGQHTSTDGEIGQQLLTDVNWQTVFQIHKVLNGVAMATLIAISSSLVAKLFGKPIGLTWGAMTAFSMGTTVLSYQLRNEFYSAYFFYIAGLLLWLKVKKSYLHGSADSNKSISFCTFLITSSLLYLSMLAKVQVFPLIAGLNIGVVAAAVSRTGCDRKAWLGTAAKTVGLCLAIALAIQHHSLSAVTIATTSSVLLFMLIPLIASCQLTTKKDKLTKRETIKVLSAFALPTAAYALIVDRLNWQTISWDPYAMSRYRIDQNGTCTIRCYAERIVDGISGLFERSFDGLIIAQILSIAIPMMLLIAHVNANSRKQSQPLQNGAIWPVSLCGAAIAMSMVASMRWPVDHYLPYQQPLLYLSLLIAAKDLWPKTFWKVLTTYALISLTLINLRYPPLAKKTFIKYTSEYLEERIYSHRLISDTEPICWPQHAGAEWDHSILGRACRW